MKLDVSGWRMTGVSCLNGRSLPEAMGGNKFVVRECAPDEVEIVATLCDRCSKEIEGKPFRYARMGRKGLPYRVYVCQDCNQVISDGMSEGDYKYLTKL